MTIFLHYPQTFNSIKFEDHIVIILTLGGNLSYFTLCLRGTLPMINFLHYPRTFKWAELSILNIFPEVPRGTCFFNKQVHC